MKFIRSSIARKIALAVGLSCLVVTLLGLTWMMRLFKSDILEHSRQSLEMLSKTLQAGFLAIDDQAGSHPFREMIAEVASRKEILRVRVFDPQGTIIWSQDADEPGNKVAPELLATFRSGRMSTLQDPDASDVEILSQVRARQSCLACHAKESPIAQGDLLGGIHVEASYAELTGKLTGYGHLQIVTALLLVAFVSIMTVLMVRYFLVQPLRNLTRVIEAAEAGNFLTRVDVKSPDEIGRLATDFNKLLARLTDVEASKIDTDMELDIAQRELSLKAELEEKNSIIEETNRKLSRRLRELALLYDFTRTLGARLELDQVLKVINEKIGEALGFSGFAVLIASEDKPGLQLRSTLGRQVPSDLLGRRFDLGEEPLSSSPLAEAMRIRKAVLVQDMAVERPSALDGSPLLPENGSLLCIPMRSRDRFLGLITFARAETGAFPEDEVQLLASVTQAAAMAVLNAQLYQEKLDLSITDELTQLANRRQMHTRLDREWHRATRFGSPLSLLMIDIDHFKRYNDINGHLLGDEVLKAVAAILRDSTRNIDTVARFGGEEFVVILPGQDKGAAINVADKLRRAVYTGDFPRAHRQPGGHLTISLGAASYPEDAEEPHLLLDRSDMALYVAKRSGRNRTVVYEAGMQEHEEERRRHREEQEKKKKRRRRRKKSKPRLDFLEPT